MVICGYLLIWKMKKKFIGGGELGAALGDMDNMDAMDYSIILARYYVNLDSVLQTHN